MSEGGSINSKIDSSDEGCDGGIDQALGLLERPRRDPRRRIRRDSDSWRFRDPDVGCQDRHDSVGQ